MLTGFDSQYVNTLYLDEILETDKLIQAISRTNRVYDKEEKPFGIFRFYRKPYTMQKNENKNADYLLWNGNRVQIKRVKFEKYVDSLEAIWIMIKDKVFPNYS